VEVQGFMYDTEARYLIDLFNTYASWSLTAMEAKYPRLALVIAILAFIFSFAGAMGLSPKVLGLGQLGLYLGFSVALFCLIILVVWSIITLANVHKGNLKKLIALESHRYRYKSLPDDLTLEKIVKLKPKDLEKFLVASK